MNYNVDMRLDQILGNKQAADIFDRFLPGMRGRIEDQPAIKGMSVRKLVEYAKGAIPESVLDILNAELGKISLEESGEDVLERAEALRNSPLTEAAKEQVMQPAQTAIYPGRVWRDTNGRRIQAHAGGLFYEDGTYYWYGENKERTDGVCSIWTWGIRAYASKDLYNWEDRGLIIEPDLENPGYNLYPTARVDRPHIMKCGKTGKYVCWIKLSGDEACFLVLQADAFMGPYEVVAENYRPFGMKVGDFDMVQDEAGKAYLFMDADHVGIIGMELSGDFLTVAREVSRQYEGLHAPFCREGVTLLERMGKKYMLTSGMSGYIPNKSDCAVSEGWEQPFVSIGNPHVADDTNASFNSQISQVFKVPGKKDLYISIADRWVPGYPVDARRADMIERAIASHYEPEKYQVSPEEKKELMNSPMLESANTSAADYVWLPLAFEGDRVCIRWQDEWKLEDYE
ncbi:MAG: family 43 glycosylhydrolase [Lachnospiraceae bacterium]|nr:family 43 glycosylhydrolase [Lachnospiraceae bacterium]MCM1240714.1 family 43 glycosylhydrolase [Lachnospiraceae bacterium]